MQAKIKAEKVVYRGEQWRKITRLEGILPESELPKDYIGRDIGCWPENSAPVFWLTAFGELRAYVPGSEMASAILNDYVHDISAKADWHGPDPGMTRISIWPGCMMSEAAFQELLTWLKRAGARLAVVNKRQAEANKDWHGEEEFVI